MNKGVRSSLQVAAKSDGTICMMDRLIALCIDLDHRTRSKALEVYGCIFCFFVVLFFLNFLCFLIFFRDIFIDLS